MKRTVPILLVVIVAIAFAGLSRIPLDADIFNLLPLDSSVVQSLQRYQKDFGSSNELIILLRSDDAATTETAMKKLVIDLEASGLTSRIVWRNPFQYDKNEMAELLAYLWFNEPPVEFAAMARRFDDGQLEDTLNRSLERMAVSFHPIEVGRLARDPFALSDIADETLMPVTESAEDPFTTNDGRSRILIVGTSFESAGFRQVSAWVTEITDFLDQWVSDSGYDGVLTTGITGNPAFVKESGLGLVQDVELAAGGTLIVVLLLFWFVHRRWRPLFSLVVLLGLVLSATALAGGLLFGTIFAVSLGFAAILLGLAADYGLILYQETIAHPGRPLREYRAAVGPAILWSAITTAGAFFMIGRSSLPGLTQLGILVGIGILIAALVMLSAYLPLAGALAPDSGRPKREPPKIFGLGTGTALGITGLAALLSAVMLTQRQPAVQYDAESLGFRVSTARDVLEEIRRDIGGFDDDLWLIITGVDEAAVRQGLRVAQPLLDRAIAEGTLTGYNLPDSLWPRPAEQAENRDTLRHLVGRWNAASAAARAAGFVDAALELDEVVFEAWARFDDADGVVWPDKPGARWAFRQFAAREDGHFAALGRLDASEQVSRDALLGFAEAVEQQNAGQLVSWSLLSDSILVVVNRDINRVLIPMAIAMLAILIVAFRGPSEVILSIACLTLSLAVLLAFMAMFGWSWNLMNVMALPMLFGAGVDYVLHIQFAMKRYDGDQIQARNTVGRAILLCAASTAAGFATLGFASNVGVASLGRVCAMGIVIASLIAVFLLPAWWRVMPGTGPRGRSLAA